MTNIDGKQELNHRLVWLLHKGSMPKGVIDHIDRNKLNNQIENLRDVLHAENARNIGIRKNNTSGFKGVGWANDRKKWQASIRHNGKNKHLGSFNTKEEAIEARKQAEKEYEDIGE